ncbi:Gtpase activating protein [Coemansia aciculifera]|uniref:Gtpase activating protein n=1 Tax=Coemansia aciculifera TaxID=417176 RepID=A0A9W8IIY2_9FUNG|nr:Gtpase activating protein [Coemansia aciculifera]KAJ2869899.1 Gtpase activating protein [Coemansia aciculifera]
MVTLTDKDKKKLAEKHNKLLAELVKQPDNSTCADCGATGPRWASWNLGVFLCIRCGGFHRRIGTHISKVKSISLDNWTHSEIEHFRKIGNKRANDYFNPSPSRHKPPSSDSDLERYIRDKYERRRFVDGRNGVPDPTSVNASVSKPDPPLSPSAGSDEASALTRLREMGFLNVRDNHAALKRFEFNVEAAAAYLRGESAPARPKISATDPRVKQLLNMGFDHTGQNVLALTQCNGDVNQAIELLLSDKPPPRTSAAPGSSARNSPVPPAPVPKQVLKSPLPAAVPPASSATADLLDGDFIGGPLSNTSKPPTMSTTSNNLGALLGNMSLSPVAANTQSSNDAFGDFGDFLSAAPTTRATAQPQATATGRTSETLVASAASPPGHGGQSMFDNDFIMSLYSKAPAQTPAAKNGPLQPSAASTSAPKPGASSSSAFGDLDFFM